jgi:hypothetical protein
VANIEDVHRRLIELLTELIELNLAAATIVATEEKQDVIISQLEGSLRTINVVEVNTSGSTVSGLQSVSLLYEGNGGTLNGVTVPNRYMASFSPNGINDTVDSVSYTPPTTGAGRIIITSVA